ncbi:hypothetical protein CGLO_05258 [Colletotrichum gloeosporioides Cg-14]|uniref:Zn(2)-C6 fungal-type domain-containing protein n=1 Tax=Colletotrichum gloeosporioides (strain Cg-14) TaxID=1237896 RepID=T0KRX0_COLGC|nr:hypothetical protein CGLO_05258 [Colletotrichum gloeosporioides Cg-14]
MRQTLRRSCDTCAKSKHSCDLRTPRCSRCVKRKILCVYANEPLTAPPPPPPTPAAPGPDATGAARHHHGSGALTSYRIGSLDPFDSYPQTRLPREHVQRLIHSFLHKIAFQYYPLDLNATSNPFLVSWWPLALGDPALFHVSLQTACLDEEMLAQKGFQASEILMADSVALLRRKVEDTSLAVQDGTMNSVITLAAIEFGKGNIQVSEMHVDGVARLVNIRGGINSVRQTSPLTARMVSWVSMIVKGHPQFETQDDDGVGHGIPPIPEWQQAPTIHDDDLFNFADQEVDLILNAIVTRFTEQLRRLDALPRVYSSLDVWFQAIGMVSAAGTPLYDSFVERAWVVAASLELGRWDDAFLHVKSVLWLETPQGEDVFRPHWGAILGPESGLSSPQTLAVSISPSSTIAVGFR